MDKMTNQIRAVLRRIGAISEDEYRCVRIETGSPDPEHRSLAKDLAIAVLDRAFVKVDTRLVELSVFIMPGPFYSTFYFEIGLCTNIKGRAFSVVEDLNIDTDPQHPEVMLCIPDMVAAKLRKIDIYKANEPAPRRGEVAVNIYTPPPKLCVKCRAPVGPGDYESIPAHVDCILLASVMRQIEKEKKAEAKAVAELERRKNAKKQN